MSLTYPYPKYVEQFGFKHRRQHYKYVQLPELWQRLRQAEVVFIEFIHFKAKIINCNFSLTELEERVKMNYRQAWLDYYGIDAEEHLQKYAEKDCVRWVESKELLSLLLQSTTPTTT